MHNIRISLAIRSEAISYLNQFKIALRQHDYNLIWLTHSEQDTITRCTANTPDILLIDLKCAQNSITPIMQNTPCSIILLTENTLTQAIDIALALSQGARDMVGFPFTETGATYTQKITYLFNKLSAFQYLPTPTKKQIPPTQLTPKSVKKNKPTSLPYLIVLGASTGGPHALAKILSGLPSDLKAAVVIIQHLDENFSRNLMIWLRRHTQLPVEIAIAGQKPQAGKVYIAGRNAHLSISAQLQFTYNVEPKTIHYRPSVDVFFNSLVAHWQPAGIAILLTGMGRDGAQGLANLFAAGWYTLAQDKNSSVVYGMPKAAQELGAAHSILPLTHMSQAIMKQYYLQ